MNISEEIYCEIVNNSRLLSVIQDVNLIVDNEMKESLNAANETMIRNSLESLSCEPLGENIVLSEIPDNKKHNDEKTKLKLKSTKKRLRDVPLTGVEVVGGEYLCQLCNKPFSKEKYWRKHLRSKHKINVLGEPIPEVRYPCDLCSKTFSGRQGLKNHIEFIHNFDNKPKPFSCTKCSYTCTYSNNLKRHNEVMHDNPKKKKNLPCVKCSVCEKKFTTAQSVRRHETKYHQISHEKMKSAARCAICSFTCDSIRHKEMYAHLEDVHGINLEWEVHNFNSMEEFTVWRKDMEKRTMACYCKKFQGKYSVYTCRRSGIFMTKGSNKRRMKTIGSCRINGFCPSTVKVRTLSDGLVEVLYLKTHVGHSNELKHLRLKQQKEVKALVTQSDEILPSVYESLTDTEELAEKHQKIQLDLKENLANTDEHDSNEKPKDAVDSLNFDAIARDLEQSKDTLLLIYKCQGVVSDSYPELEENDFFLVYMTTRQRTLLENYGDDVICIDHNKLYVFHGHNLQSFTVLVMNKRGEGFPVAFMFSNRTDEAVLETFFNEIKQTLSCPVACNILRTDLGESSYSAWVKVMGAPKVRVFCTWHILRDWRENINSKIKHLGKRETIYNFLQTLIRERDENTFLYFMINWFSEVDDEKRMFHEYFNKEFVINRPFRLWAHCFGKNGEVNTAMPFEDLNKALKFFYIINKKDQTLEDKLCAILHVIKKNLLDFGFDVERATLHRKLDLLSKRHKKSSLTDVANVIEYEDGWMVLPSKAKGNFFAVKCIKKCPGCRLECIHCKTCVHEYVCSCKDYALGYNLCKHIHLVSQVVGNAADIAVEYVIDSAGEVEVGDKPSQQEVELPQENVVEVCPDSEKSVWIQRQLKRLNDSGKSSSKRLKTDRPSIKRKVGNVKRIIKGQRRANRTNKLLSNRRKRGGNLNNLSGISNLTNFKNDNASVLSLNNNLTNTSETKSISAMSDSTTLRCDFLNSGNFFVRKTKLLSDIKKLLNNANTSDELEYYEREVRNILTTNKEKTPIEPENLIDTADFPVQTFPVRNRPVVLLKFDPSRSTVQILQKLQ